MAILPAPPNKLLTVINAILSALIKGLGVDVAMAATVAQVPWLGIPVVNWLLNQVVSAIAQSLDTQIQINLDNVLIRFQDDVKKIEYDQTIADMQKTISTPGVSDADKNTAIAAAEAALATLINRSN